MSSLLFILTSILVFCINIVSSIHQMSHKKMKPMLTLQNSNDHNHDINIKTKLMKGFKNLSPNTRIMKDIYFGLMDGLTDEITKKLVMDTSFIHNYMIDPCILKSLTSDIISRIWISSSKLPIMKSYSNTTTNIDKSRRVSENTRFLRQFNYVYSAKHLSDFNNSHNNVQMSSNEDANSTVRHQIKFMTSLMSRYVLIPAIVHSVAHAVPVSTVHYICDSFQTVFHITIE